MGIDFSWFFEENRTATRDEMPLPSISELKAYIKLKKTESADAAKYYDPGDGFPAYNPKLMEEALILLTDEKAGIYPKARYRSELSAIYLYSGRGEGLVFPVRKKMQAATE